MPNKKEEIKIKGRLRYTVYDPETGAVRYQSPFMPNNIVVNAGNGVNLLIKNFLGLESRSFEATAAMIGTDDTPPSDSDTGLFAPETNSDGGDFAVTRSSQEETSLDTAVVNFFFADNNLENGTTYREFAVYVGGDATPTTLTNGRLWSRLLITPTYTHNGGDVAFEYQLTIST